MRTARAASLYYDLCTLTLSICRHPAPGSAHRWRRDSRLPNHSYPDTGHRVPPCSDAPTPAASIAAGPYTVTIIQRHVQRLWRVSAIARRYSHDTQWSRAACRSVPPRAARRRRRDNRDSPQRAPNISPRNQRSLSSSKIAKVCRRPRSPDKNPGPRPEGAHSTRQPFAYLTLIRVYDHVSATI